jgi:hypothetical protein
MIQALIKNKIIWAVIGLTSLVMIANIVSGPRTVILHFEDQNRNGGTRVTVIDELGNRMNLGMLDQQGKMSFEYQYPKEMTRIRFEFSNSNFDSFNTLDFSYWYPLEGRKELSVNFRSEKSQTGFTIRTNPVTDGVRIERINLNGSQRGSIGVTGPSGAIAFMLKTTELANTMLRYSHPDYHVVSEYQNRAVSGYPSTVTLQLYPAQDVQFTVRVVNRQNRPQRNISVRCENTQDTLETNASGEAGFAISRADFLQYRIQMGSQLMMVVNGNRYTITVNDSFLEGNRIYTIQVEQFYSRVIKVHSEGDQAPIRNARIFLNDEEVGQTGINGEYIHRYSESQIGQVSLIVRANEFSSHSQNIQFSNQDGLTTVVTLKPLYVIIRCMDQADGAPIMLSLGNIAQNSQYRIAQGADGTLKLFFHQFTTGSIPLSVNMPGYAPFNGTFTINNISSFGNRYTVRLTKIVHIAVKTIDPAGMPISGVTVYNIAGIDRGQTDGNGRFAYEVPENISLPVQWRLEKEGYETQTVSINALNTDIPVTLRPLQVTFTVYDSHNKNLLPQIPFRIDGQIYRTDSQGKIIYSLSQIPSQLLVTLIHPQNIYQAFEHSYNIPANNRNYTIRLNPYYYLSIKAVDNLGNALPDVDIFVDGTSKGKTNEEGILKVTIDKLGTNYVVKGQKALYEDGTGFADANQLENPVQIRLSSLQVYLDVKGRNDISLAGIKVVTGSSQVDSDDNGRAKILLNQLNIPVKIQLSDPSKTYRDTLITRIPKSNGETLTPIRMTRNPIFLTIQVVGDFAFNPGTIKIDPLPMPNNPNSGTIAYNKKQVKIELYEAVNRRITYIPNGWGLEYNSTWENSGSSHTIQASLPRYFVNVDDAAGPNVQVYHRNSVADIEGNLIGNITGNGQQAFVHNSQASNYYRLVFTYPGWAQPTTEYVQVTADGQVFDFRILDDQYRNCKKLQSQKQFKEACAACEQISGGDYYSRALETLADMYYELDDWENVVNTILRLMELPNYEISAFNYTRLFYAGNVMDEIPPVLNDIHNNINYMQAFRTAASSSPGINTAEVFGYFWRIQEKLIRQRIQALRNNPLAPSADKTRVKEDFQHMRDYDNQNNHFGQNILNALEAQVNSL